MEELNQSEEHLVGALRSIYSQRRTCKRAKPNELCFYCGISATGYDHVIPYVVFGENTLLVPCCLECNCLLGSKVFSDAWEKKSYIGVVLQKRYSIQLNLREEQLKGLEGRLLENFQSELKFKRWIQLRIEFANLDTSSCQAPKQSYIGSQLDKEIESEMNAIEYEKILDQFKLEKIIEARNRKALRLKKELEKERREAIRDSLGVLNSKPRRAKRLKIISSIINDLS